MDRKLIRFMPQKRKGELTGSPLEDCGFTGALVLRVKTLSAYLIQDLTFSG